jgi:hypothetical protein
MATFHPELTGDTTVHEYFVKMAAEPRRRDAVPSSPKAAVSS